MRAARCSCDEEDSTCCFREGHHVLGCQDWKEYVLFIQPDAVSDTPPNQQEPAPRDDVEAAGVNSQFQVGAYLVVHFDGTSSVRWFARKQMAPCG